MADDDIPVLVDVHARPNASATAAPFVLTADIKAALIAELTPPLRAQLAAEMRDEIQSFIASETQKSSEVQHIDAHKVHAEIQARLQDETTAHLDKLKADLSTDLPKMLHTNAALIEADLQQAFAEKLTSMQAASVESAQLTLSTTLPEIREALMREVKETLATVETNSVMQASQALRDKMVAMDEGIFKAHQSKMTDAFNVFYDELAQKSQTELSVFVEALQLQSQQQLEEKLAGSFPALYQQMADQLMTDLKSQLTALADETRTDFTEALNVAMPAVETALADKVNTVLADEMPKIQQHLSETIQAEVKQILSEVRLAV